jgi:hypothetical protein
VDPEADADASAADVAFAADAAFDADAGSAAGAFFAAAVISTGDDAGAPVGAPPPVAAAEGVGLFPTVGAAAGGVSGGATGVTGATGARCSATAVAWTSAVVAENGRSTGRVAKYSPAPTNTQAASGTQTHKLPRVEVGPLVRSPSGTAVSFNRAINANARRHLAQVAKWASHSARSAALMPSST